MPEQVPNTLRHCIHYIVANTSRWVLFNSALNKMESPESTLLVRSDSADTFHKNTSNQ
jgi:hypothetical protein